MALQKYSVDFARISDAALAAWREIPAAVVSDMMNRSQVMAARVKPVGIGMRLCGQARTVTCMSGDNSAPHRLIGMCRKGEVMIIDARGSENVAIWGGIMTEAAIARGVSGIVVEGAIRDIAEIRARGFAAFSTAVVPAGPHKNFGGTIDGTVAVGDCPVNPGDLIIGDDDGVAVVPLAWADRMLKAAQQKIADEADIIRKIHEGANQADLLGLPEPELIS
ncbi:MAG: RraA family protein [Rhodospirillales bacterium]|jgi:4-hydroxy-4-methyl-2-oxoglutarate aldolase|nr:RraA family protein [Rhodospirillales bacterium]